MSNTAENSDVSHVKVVSTCDESSVAQALRLDTYKALQSYCLIMGLDEVATLDVAVRNLLNIKNEVVK